MLYDYSNMSFKEGSGKGDLKYLALFLGRF